MAMYEGAQTVIRIKEGDSKAFNVWVNAALMHICIR